jgi:hypothetical protein
MDILIDICY